MKIADRSQNTLTDQPHLLKIIQTTTGHPALAATIPALWNSSREHAQAEGYFHVSCRNDKICLDLPPRILYCRGTKIMAVSMGENLWRWQRPPLPIPLS